ncbi:alpha/beta fold hydrolase [Pararoseomonas indoligenes]|uniref:Alpha/beta hydrolase n=1 Tax=Roseomonas indoligenes TaxID=2820811 RepID=A0A940S6W1_9PROT|nr:alpha/beta hydrolase [Pararoseomonas indoligenes]MBP0494429.1 alpha/beta hydrolase [Pararoseomonas indoligenes]
MDGNPGIRRRAIGLGSAVIGAGLLAATGSRAQPAAVPSAPPTEKAPYNPRFVASPDGVRLATYEFGNPQGPAILFLHGFAQAALSWDRQLRDPALAREFRMVAIDLRGHGMSAKPEGDAFYKPGQVWADDVKAVIAGLGLQRPVLVGWSYAGRVVGDYLTAHGASALAGINYVDASSTLGNAAFFGPDAGLLGPSAMLAPGIDGFIDGTVRFLRSCFATQPDPADFQTMLAFNMLAPHYVRAGLAGRPANYDEVLKALRLPVLVSHGEKDRILTTAMARFTAATVPGATLSLYPESGHAPFWEEPARFNRELAGFVRQVQAAR